MKIFSIVLFIFLLLTISHSLNAKAKIIFSNIYFNNEKLQKTQIEFNEKYNEACKKVINRMKVFDWNSLKKNKPFKEHIFLKQASKKNLNKLPLLEENRIAYQLKSNDLMIFCGTKVLERNMVTGVFLESYGIFGAKSGKLKKIIIRHNGYFME